MSTIKSKDLRKMNKLEREKKLNDLKFEMIKAKTNTSKKSNTNIKEMRKIIARIITINQSEEGGLKKK